jgi:hypothetical protein
VVAAFNIGNVAFIGKYCGALADLPIPSQMDNSFIGINAFMYLLKTIFRQPF